MDERDTIAAISTPLGEGGIGIVRLSGSRAFSLAERVFLCSRSGEKAYPVARHLYYGHIQDRECLIVDEVLVSFMPAPHTYTRENVVEINCHSGNAALRSVLQTVLEAGARLAEPGEFTRRAFENGRIDLCQAESILSVINARSERALKTAVLGVQGVLSEKIGRIRDEIVAIRAPLEAAFDYPDEMPAGDPGVDIIGEQLQGLREMAAAFLKGTESNRAYQEGITITLVGRPNVGKSSLLNAMLRQKRAIVHEVPGTTRDLLEGQMNLGGYPLRLIDTAGIHITEDPVEIEGISRSQSAAKLAGLLVVVLDGSAEWQEGDLAVARLAQEGRGAVVAVNKVDLRQKLSLVTVKELFPGCEIVETAALQEEGIENLERAIVSTLDQTLGIPGDNSLIVSMRHEKLLRAALGNIKDAQDKLGREPLEIISLELQQAWTTLGEITGDNLQEALLDKIFSSFCLGK